MVGLYRSENDDRRCQSSDARTNQTKTRFVPFFLYLRSIIEQSTASNKRRKFIRDQDKRDGAPEAVGQVAEEWTKDTHTFFFYFMISISFDNWNPNTEIKFTLDLASTLFLVSKRPRSSNTVKLPI